MVLRSAPSPSDASTDRCWAGSKKPGPFRALMPQKDFSVQRHIFPVFRAKFPVSGEQGISLQVLESYMHSTGPVPSPEAKLIFPVNFPVSKIGPGSESLPATNRKTETCTQESAFHT